MRHCRGERKKEDERKRSNEEDKAAAARAKALRERVQALEVERGFEAACLPAPSISTLLGAIADACVVNQRVIIKKERGLVSRAMEEYNRRYLGGGCGL